MMPVFGTWKFTLTAQNALMSAAKWLGKAPTTPDMAFDDLREAVRKGDRNAARAMVWLGFCVGKDSNSEIDSMVEAKAKAFVKDFLTGKGCPRDLRLDMGEMLEKYYTGYEKSEKVAEGVLNTLVIMEKELRDDMREAFREEKKVKD